MNHTKLNQHIPDYSTNIRSINDSADICTIEKILLSPVHLVHTPYPVPAPRKKILMGQQVNLHHHHITHHHKTWQLKKILRHVINHPIRYRTYNMTRIQIQVCQIILCCINLTHQTTSILNKDDEQKIIKINVGLKRVSVNLSKSAQRLQPSYLQLRKNIMS